MKFQNNNPLECGPAPWWTLSGTLDRDEIVRQMDEMKSKHIYEVLLYANYGLEKPDFLSDEWFDCVGFMLEEFAKRDMACWIYDELSWPSGTAGGIIPRDYPEYRMRCIDRKEIKLAPGESIDLPSGDMVRFCGWFADGSRTPEKLVPGTTFVNNTAAEGEILILEVILIESVFFHNLGTESTWNQPGQLDALNPAAVRCWMSYIHEQYKARFSQYFGTTLRGFFYDETTMTSVDKTHRLPWTWDLEESFRAEYGYDCCDNYWKLIRECDDAEQFRYDFWRFTGKRFADAFAKQMGDWCAENNLALTGHGWPEEPACQRLMINTIGDLHYQQQHCQVPGTDHLELKNCFSENIGMGGNVPGWARNYIYSVKHAPSTMRYNGGNRSLVEISGICGFSSPLSDQRWCMDFMFAMGISMINSAIGFCLRDFRKYGCCAERAMPYYEHYQEFSDYIARGSFFNSRGLMKTPIAVLNPLSSKFSQSVITPDTSMRQEKTPFAEGADSCEATLRVLDALCRTHRDFEILFEDILVNGSVKDGKFAVPRSEFEVIVVPQAQVMDDAVAAKLAEFTAAGGKVVAVGCTPKRTVRAGKNAINVDLSKVASHQIDWQGDDFQMRFEKLISGLCAPSYIIRGEKAHEVISQLRQDGDWLGLWINNATPGDKVLTMEYPALGSPDAVFDPGDGVYYRPEAAGKIVLQDSQSLVFVFDKTLPVNEFAPAETAPWYAGKGVENAVGLPLEWNLVSQCINTLRPALELWHEGKYIEIEDSGFCPFQLDPEKEPLARLRGRFTVADAVPGDLRLRFDADNFSDLQVNGQAVTAASLPEAVFDSTNVAVNIADYCVKGENVFTVTVPVSKWYGMRYGLRLHFVNLVKLLDLIPLAGTFGVDANGAITAVPQKFVAGDLRGQALPQFGGKLTMRAGFDCPAEKLNSHMLTISRTDAALRIKLNGVELGTKIWKYGNLVLPEKLLKEQNNILEMEIMNTMGNLYARRWDGNPERQLAFVLPELALY